MDLLESMRAFVEIVERGSLTAAARALDRSQPAMVRTLAALEERLGTRLLNRTTRRMSLTPEGREFLGRCRLILADVAEAERAVGRGHSEPRGDLRVTAPVLFGQMHVAPALTAFLRRYRAVRVELLLLDRNIDLVEEGIDLGVRIGPLPDSTMIATPIRRVRRLVCASPALLADVGTPTHPRQLAGLPCIHFTGLASPVHWRFQHDGRALSVNVTGNLSCNHLGVAREACVEGLGFSRFLSYQVESLIEQGSLEVVLAEFEPDPSPVSLIYPASRLVSTRQRALVAWLKERLAA